MREVLQESEGAFAWSTVLRVSHLCALLPIQGCDVAPQSFVEEDYDAGVFEHEREDI